MTNLDQSPKHSPLTQLVTRDDETVSVEIYEDGEDRWLLEVVDEFGNSTVWDATFESDQDALDEALRTINEDGIDSLIGPSPEDPKLMDIDQPLSEAELDELDDFLAQDALQESSMDVSTLEGFLTSIAISPRFVRPSDWLPWVWDMDEGEAEAEFENGKQANRILSLVMRHYNDAVKTFNTDPASFEPIFWRGNQWGAAEWCEGFILGFQFNEKAWSLLAAGQPTWFSPFLRLGTDEGIDFTKRADDAEEMMNGIESSLLRIHAYWKENRDSSPAGMINDDYYHGGQQEVGQIVRSGPKIGRNDPCPCGSGKKFKKCCGADGAPSSVH